MRTGRACEELIEEQRNRLRKAHWLIRFLIVPQSVPLFLNQFLTNSSGPSLLLSRKICCRELILRGTHDRTLFCMEKQLLCLNLRSINAKMMRSLIFCFPHYNRGSSLHLFSQKVSPNGNVQFLDSSSFFPKNEEPRL